MKTRYLISMLACLALAFGVSCATDGSGGKSSTSGSGNSTQAAAEPGDYAYGTTGDSKQACLDRIPSDASSGQRMLAEQSCERDEANRMSIQAVPGE